MKYYRTGILEDVKDWLGMMETDSILCPRFLNFNTARIRIQLARRINFSGYKADRLRINIVWAWL